MISHLNYDEIEEFYKLAKELEVYSINFCSVLNPHHKTKKPKEHEEFSAFINEARKVEPIIKEKIDNLQKQKKSNEEPYITHQFIGEPNKQNCIWLFYRAYITVEGYVTPCCVISDPEVFNFGNIFEQDFKEIWNGKKFVEFRKSMIENSKNEICDNCSYAI